MKPADKSEATIQRNRLVAIAAMTCILLLAFAQGAHGLNLDPIWADELYSLTSMGAFESPYTLGEVVQSLRRYNPDHVPLYFYIGALWARIAGWSQLSMRLISLLFGMLTAATLYRFGAQVVSQRTALVAAFLTVTSAFVILYFHDLRMYTMLMWLGILHTWLYWRIAHGHHVSRLTWVLFYGSAISLFYTHNFSTLVFAGLAFYHLLFIKKSLCWLKIVVAWCICALVFLPYAPFVIDGILLHQEFDRNPLDTLAVIDTFALLLANGQIILWLPILLTVGYALARRQSGSILRILAVASSMVVVLLAVHTAFHLITITRLRYLLVPWLLINVVIAFGIAEIPKHAWIAHLLILAWLIAGYRFTSSGDILNYAGLMSRTENFPPLHQYERHLRDSVASTDFLVGFDESGVVSQVHREYYSANSISDYYLQTMLGIDGTFLHPSKKRYRLERDVREILQSHPHVLLAHDPSNVPLNYARTLAIIEEAYVPCTSLVEEPALRIRKYTHPVMGCDREPASIQYENGARLLDRAIEFDIDDQRIDALTWWDIPDDEMLNQYNISLQIITSDWQNIRQVDRHLHDDLVPWGVSELSTADLPSGDYRLMLIVYDRFTGVKLGGIDLISSQSGEILPLLSFEIDSQ